MELQDEIKCYTSYLFIIHEINTKTKTKMK